MIDVYDFGLISQHALDSITRDEMTNLPMSEIRLKNNHLHYLRMTNWFGREVPRGPTTIYEFNNKGEVVPVVYQTIRDNPKVRAGLGRPKKSERERDYS